MEDNLVNSIYIDTHNHDEVDSGSTLSSKK